MRYSSQLSGLSSDTTYSSRRKAFSISQKDLLVIKMQTPRHIRIVQNALREVGIPNPVIINL